MKDVHELFHRDPLSLTKSDLDAIISHFRAKRRNMAAEPAALLKKRVRSSKPKIDVPGLVVDLGDL